MGSSRKNLVASPSRGTGPSLSSTRGRHCRTSVFLGGRRSKSHAQLHGANAQARCGHAGRTRAIPPWGKDILVVFEDVESYYKYVSYYYPDAGEFAFSSGMYIDTGCAHFVTVKADLRAIEPVIAHEMTHGCLTHLPLPLWLNEGLAVNTEHRIARVSGSHLTAHELHRKHLSFWRPQEIQEFWSGESFKRTDDGDILSYDLARFIVAQFAKDWETFKDFVLDADAADAGAASAQEHLRIDLGAIACALLQKKSSPQWQPDPRTWPARDLIPSQTTATT